MVSISLFSFEFGSSSHATTTTTTTAMRMMTIHVCFPLLSNVVCLYRYVSQWWVTFVCFLSKTICKTFHHNAVDCLFYFRHPICNSFICISYTFYFLLSSVRWALLCSYISTFFFLLSFAVLLFIARE